LLRSVLSRIIGPPDPLIALEAVPTPLERTPEPKASRVRVWQACDRVLRSGRRPTVEGIREILGGGSPNSVTAYINEWYRELGSRLAAAETPLAGFPPEAVSLMTELWRLAAADQRVVRDQDAADHTATRMLTAERDVLAAEGKALQTLNQELQRHRSTAEKSLAEARALLSRREAALEEERSRAAALEQALAQTRLELEVANERHRLAAAKRPTTRSERRSRLVAPSAPRTVPKRGKAKAKSRPRKPTLQTRKKSGKFPTHPRRARKRSARRR